MPVLHEDTYLFIDGEYLRHIYNEAMQSVFGCDGELSFGALKQAAQAKRTFFYDCVDDVPRASESQRDLEVRVAAQEVFFDGIRALYGVHVRLGSLRGNPKRPRQKEVDVLLATDMLTHGYDGNMMKAILIAGDLDFRPIVEALVRRGVFIEIWYGTRSVARELPGAADYGRELNFRELYGWSKDSFKARCAVPQASPAHAELDRPVVITQCVCEGRKVTLFRDSQIFVIRAERSEGVHWLEHADANVLKRYFSVIYGPVEWM